MPSVDVIRNIRIQGSAPGVDDATAALNRMKDSIISTGQNLNLLGSRSANDNLRLIADNTAALNQQMLSLDQSTKAATESYGIHWTSLLLKIAAVAAGLGALYTAAKLVYEAVTLGPKLLAEAWELGSAKLAEYVAISEKASAAGLSTDFFQRLGKAATDAKIPVDSLTAAMTALQAATADQLGGTSAQQRLKDLADAGNFKGNSGVGQLANANTTEEKFRAITTLIDQATAKGERLAALDVAKTFLGADVANNLAKDSDYLDKILQAADAVAAKDLVSQASVDNAVALQNRLDAAEQILSQRWHPIQDLLTQLGIKMKEAWVDIVEAIAKAVDLVFTLAGKIPDMLGPLLGYLQTAEQVLALAARVAGSALGPAGAAISAGGAIAGGLLSGPATSDGALAAARARLSSGLGNPANVSAARDQVNAIQNRVFADTSKNPADKTTPDTAAYDRATEAVLKYIATTNAAAGAVSDAAGEQEKFKVVAQLTAAAEKDGTTVTAALRDEMDKLGARAGAAADALAKAKAASNIEFNTKTAFLSQEDVQIATQLKGIYGNDVPAALNSTYASAIRVNDAFKQVSSAIETNVTQGLTDIATGAATAGNAFANMGKMIVTAIEQMIIKLTIVQPLMQALQSSISGSSIFGSLFGGGAPGVTASGSIIGAVGPTSVGGLPLVGLHGGGIVGSEATFSRYVHPAYFDDAPRFHSGGIAGDEVPIIARKGEGVFTPGQMAAMGGQSTTINYAPNIDARGADAQAVARIANVMAQDRKNFERNVQAVIGKTRANNPGAFR